MNVAAKIRQQEPRTSERGACNDLYQRPLLKSNVESSSPTNHLDSAWCWEKNSIMEAINKSMNMRDIDGVFD